MSRGKQPHVVGVVRCDHSAAEPDRRGNDEGVDRQLASCVGIGKEVACDPGDANTGRDDLHNAPNEDTIDDLVSSSPSV